MPPRVVILSRVNTFLGTFSTNETGKVMNVMSNAVPCLVVNVIFLMSAALWSEAVVGVLGGWILLAILAVTVVGVPWAW